MAITIEVKLAARPGAFARMYVEFGKLDILPTVLEKGVVDDDDSQLLLVEIDEGTEGIQSVLAHLSTVDFLRVVNVLGEPQRTEQEAIAKEIETIKPLSESTESAKPVSDKPSINIFDNHKGRRDKF